MEISVQLFDSICRVCLIQSTELKSLFTKFNGDDRSLYEILSFTANIDVKVEDTLPKQVCTSCESVMSTADAFKRRCLESERILKKVYQNALNVDECVIKDEKHDLTQKLSDLETFSSSVPLNNDVKDDFDSKNILLVDFPTCSTNKTNFDKFPGCKTFNDDQPTVKEETTNNFDDEDNFVDDFNDTIDFEETKAVKIHEYTDKDGKEIEIKDKEIRMLYQCYCKIQFSNKNKYSTHLEKCPSLKLLYKNKKSVKNLKCTLCDKKCNTVTAWKVHQRAHCNEKNKKTELYQCSYCLRKCKNKTSLTAHIQRHEVTDNIKHVCDICKREFKYKAFLDNHISTAHSKNKGLNCNVCGQSFLNKESLEMHKKSHKDEKKHHCNVCNKAFYMLCTLKEHMRTHTGEKPYLCSQCGKGFSQKTNLAQHMRRHQGLKPFKCETCEKRFVSKGELDAHNRKHTGAHPFVCDDCGSGFTTSSALTKHRRVHSGERPYACDVCPMRFAASGTLTNHRRTHTGERPFQCSYCEKAFVQRNDLISHIRCHTGERPYVCTQCGQSFRKTSGLKTHVKMHIKDPVIGINAILTGMQCSEQ